MYINKSMRVILCKFLLQKIEEMECIKIYIEW